MFLQVEKGSSTPISRQILDQVRAQCLSGVLPPGERLPSVRELARQLAVNVNTIVRIYDRLAAEGLVELRHGDGTFVLPPGARADHRLTAQREQFDVELEMLARRGLLLGYTRAELKARFHRALTGTTTSESGPGASTSTTQEKAK